MTQQKTASGEPTGVTLMIEEESESAELPYKYTQEKALWFCLLLSSCPHLLQYSLNKQVKDNTVL